VPTRELDTISQPTVPARASFIGQATAVEQARAVAEVQAAVVVAQQVPRDMGRAVADMRDACGRIGLANRAFYSVPNRGTGPTVHLMRELARIFGNVQYGVHELRRDDDAGISEVQAFAWDVQTNVRSTRTFVVPHARMKRVGGKQVREALVDLGDIYLMNQNVGARAVRECISTILPAWFTDEAQDIAHSTLEHGEGIPLDQRITNAIAKFLDIGVTVEQLETKLGRKRGSWTPHDMAQLQISFLSISRGEVTKEEEFPQNRVTAAEIAGQTHQTADGSSGEAAPSAPTPEPTEQAKATQAAAAASWGES
jgi:hypothetical protein